MINLMDFDGHQAVINYDPEIEMFRGEFVNLNGGADFYATDIEGLHKEGEISLAMFLDMCKKDVVEPKKHYSGKFNVRLSSGLHENLVVAAASEGKSINQWVVEALTGSIERRP
jgi:predicted HicB family RNase H-like nuclease